VPQPIDLPVVARGLASWDRPNVQVALDAWTANRNVELVGLPVMQGYRAGIAELVRGSEWLANIPMYLAAEMPDRTVVLLTG
jgi:hypothetical protein